MGYAIKSNGSWRAVQAGMALAAGETYSESAPVPTEEQVTAEKWLGIKTVRNALLAVCDWTQLADTALTAEQRVAWSAYRQTLRDIPQVFASPDDVIYPTAPGA